LKPDRPAEAADVSHDSRSVRVLFHIGIFLGAYLLFVVQPLIAKQILPWFGGGPSVWSACLLFFQLGLVAGYAYTHYTRRLGLSRQITVHIVFLLLAAATLPISASAAWKPPNADAPIGRLLALLSTSVGLPYVVLATTAPLLQDWFRVAAPGRTPYKLYALSNIGSLAALLSYPIAVERFLPIGTQSTWWSAGFVAFVIVTGLCGWQVRRRNPEHVVERAVDGSPDEGRASRIDQVLWVLLSACGTGLLLAITNQLCQDIAVVPLLWILPLAIYLLTFIVAFAGIYNRAICFALFAAALAASAYAIGRPDTTPILGQVATGLFLVGSGCMLCHGELVRLKPRARDLTSFYLALACGGSLGGILVTLVAPMVFTQYTELPLFVLLVPALVVAAVLRDAARRQGGIPVLVWAIPVAAFVVAAIISLGRSQSPLEVAAARNFYGTIRVLQDRPETPRGLRALYHGRTVHGSQFIAEADSLRPTANYAPGTGIEYAFRLHPRRVAGLPLRIGVIGLGPGSIIAWSKPGDAIRFFELNPQVIDFAQRYFTYLRNSPASIDIVTGDARLSLERELMSDERPSYDLFTIDAFSSGSIPLHLLTRESFALYQQALAPDGVMAFHISNAFLDLRPVIRGLAHELSLTVLEYESPGDANRAAGWSIWVLVSADPGFIERAAPAAAAPGAGTRSLVWTDDFSSLSSVIR
jgi:hypothetical protein